MKRNIRFVLLVIFVLIFLSACSKAGKNEVILIDETTGEEIVVAKEEVEAKEQELGDYSAHLGTTFESSMSLQDQFAHGLDDLFTKESSASQFAKILKEHIIESSREVLDTGEKYNFPVDYYEMNQMVVANLNNQHQLFLDAVNEATAVAEMEGRELNIVRLRERLAGIKQEYLAIVNIWKNGGKVN